jgi:hypothetical protein
MAGLHQNLTLGKGKVFFEPFDPGTTIGHGEIYLAQTTEFSYTVAAETLDGYDADEGINVLLEQALTQVDVTGAMVTQDISMEKINLFLLGQGVQQQVVASATGSTQTLTDVKLGRYYQLGVGPSTPAGIPGCTVTGITKGGAAVAQSGNYIQTAEDISLGRLFILANAAGVLANDDLVVTFNVAATTRETVVSKDQQIRGALRFVSANAVGTQRNFYFPLVNMSPDGDYALKGNEWQTMGFAFTALKRDAATERVYVDGRAA